MKIDLVIVCIASLALAGGMLAAKYYYTWHTKKGTKRAIRYNWFFLYGNLQISGTSSSTYRRFMRRCNAMTAVSWALIAVAITAYYLSGLFAR